MAEVLTAGSIFSGIGGLDLAASLAGFDIRFQVEIDEFCRKVLTKHAQTYWPNATQFADVCHITVDDIGYVDVLFGGFPCTDISVAGNGIGLEGKNSSLWWQFARLISEIRPRVVVLENVAAILSKGRGGTEVIAALTEMGYDAQWGIISAADAQAPHLRNRWFCVAYRNSIRLPESPNTTGQQNSCHLIGNTQAEYRGDVTSPVGGNRQILRTKTRLAYPYRQRRSKNRGYRAKTRQRIISPSSMGNPNRTRRKGRNRAKLQSSSLAQSSSDQNFQNVSQSSMGRDAYGIPGKLDGDRLMQHQFPAPPNYTQHENEPPRVIGSIPYRRDRIKALGNSVVPQVAYPIFVNLYQFLAGQVTQ